MVASLVANRFGRSKSTVGPATERKVSRSYEWGINVKAPRPEAYSCELVGVALVHQPQPDQGEVGLVVVEGLATASTRGARPPVAITVARRPSSAAIRRTIPSTWPAKP